MEKMRRLLLQTKQRKVLLLDAHHPAQHQPICDIPPPKKTHEKVREVNLRYPKARAACYGITNGLFRSLLFLGERER